MQTIKKATKKKKKAAAPRRKDVAKAAQAVIDPRAAVVTLIDTYYRIQELRKALDLCEQAMCRDEVIMESGAKHAGHIVSEINGTIKLKNAEGKKVMLLVNRSGVTTFIMLRIK